MKNVNRWIGAVVGGLILVSATSVFAQNWPQWRGDNRDGKVTGFTAPQNWPTALTEKWKVTVGTGDATPALVGDKLYVFARQGDDEVTLCLDATSGKELWRDKYAAQAVTGPSSRQHSGPRSSPAVADGKVVTLGVNGTLSCLDAANGKVVWRKDVFPNVVPKYYTAMSPIVEDGMCIAHLGTEGNGALIAFDLATGEQKWKWAEDGPSYASPALLMVEGTKLVVTLTEKRVVGVGVTDGKLLWELPFAVRGMAYNAATPIVDGQTVIYTGQARGTKAVKIEKQGDSFVAKELWSNADLGTQFNSPVLKDGLLYGLSDRGNFFCINAKTGETAWTDTAKRGNFGAIVDAGSVIFALASNSELIALKLGDKQYEELARVKVASTPTYAHPIIAGKRVFVKDQDSVTLWAFE